MPQKSAFSKKGPPIGGILNITEDQSSKTGWFPKTTGLSQQVLLYCTSYLILQQHNEILTTQKRTFHE